MKSKIYRYVGPDGIFRISRNQPRGQQISNLAELKSWLNRDMAERISYGWIATFTINLDGRLYLAPRRSEHVACAAGGPVYSAGELTVDDTYCVTVISNQSTGFCPEPESWPVVEFVLDKAGNEHPGCFTTAVIFRHCNNCIERNIVKDDDFVCAICDESLPANWNFA